MSNSKALKVVDQKMAKPLADHGWVLSDQDSTMRTYRHTDNHDIVLKYNKKYFCLYRNQIKAETIQPIRNLLKFVGNLGVSITN